MGIWDNIKKGADLAIKGWEKLDAQIKKKISRISDSELRLMLDKNPNNKYAKEEARRRGF